MLLRPEAPQHGSKAGAVLFSLAVHMSLLALVAFGPRRAPKPKTAYQREIAPHEKKLVWYRFKDKLPEVAPSKEVKKPEPVRAEVKNPTQTMVSRSPRKEIAKQMTLAPAPELKLQPDLAAPNLMAFEAPPPPEPKPEPKLFVPPDLVAPPVDRPVLEQAPQVAVAENRAPLAPMPDLPKPEPKKFTPLPPVKLPWEEPKLENAPAVSIAETRNAPAALPVPSLPKPQPKKFTPPVAAPRRTDAPQLQASAAPVVPAPANPRAIAMPSIPKPQPRVFTPAPAPVKRAASAPALESASNLTAAVVGLNPVDRDMPVIPEISRPAEFSAAPEVSRTGAAEAPGESARIVIPGLSIRSGEAAPKRESIATIARVAPTSRENVLAAVKPLIPSAAIDSPATVTSPGARVGGGPDSRFGGRTVYTVAIQMPNVTSYSGSWILWYAERQRQPGESPEILPPTPLRKVDPIYDLSAAEERIEGKVQLSAVIHTDGYVYGIKVISGIDPRLDNNAVTALRKWEFQPARREGNPVDVDVVIEIPFRLRPPTKK